MGYKRAEWHSGLTYRQQCRECQNIVTYQDNALGFRPWFPDGFVYCPNCKTPLRHNENYAINKPTAPTTFEIPGGPVSTAPGQAVPAAPVEAVPAAPVETVPVAPVEAVTAAPVEAVTVAPVEAVPAAPVEAVTAAPVEAVPVAPVESTPTAPVAELVFCTQCGKQFRDGDLFCSGCGTKRS